MINVDIYRNKIWKKASLSKTEIKRIVKECLKETDVIVKDVFLNVSFVDNRQMIEYNLKYRGKNTVTNVLSFENKGCINEEKRKIKQNEPLFLGEIVLCHDQIKHEAIEFNKSFNDRLYHLFIHGVLHLLGYDHIKDTERSKMEYLETKILLKFNIKDPYFFIKNKENDSKLPYITD